MSGERSDIAAACLLHFHSWLVLLAAAERKDYRWWRGGGGGCQPVTEEQEDAAGGRSAGGSEDRLQVLGPPAALQQPDHPAANKLALAAHLQCTACPQVPLQPDVTHTHTCVCVRGAVDVRLQEEPRVMIDGRLMRSQVQPARELKLL